MCFFSKLGQKIDEGISQIPDFVKSTVEQPLNVFLSELKDIFNSKSPDYKFSILDESIEYFITIPGFKKEDIAVEVFKDASIFDYDKTTPISVDTIVKTISFVRIECQSPDTYFIENIALPKNIDFSKATASYESNVLVISFPLKQSTKFSLKVK